MRHDEAWPAAAPSAGRAQRMDVLARILREIAPQVGLPDAEPWVVEAADQDPLSPESLVAQTDRLTRLIERAKGQKDASLLRSLRRELLLTRWALVKSCAVSSRGGVGPVPKPTPRRVLASEAEA
jgi:hypothetical protein